MDPARHQLQDNAALLAEQADQSEVSQLRREVKALQALNRLALELHTVTADTVVYQRVVEQVSQALDQLTSLLEPAIVLILGLLVGGLVVYGILKSTVGLRLTQEEEFDGADLSIHKISATPDREVSW